MNLLSTREDTKVHSEEILNALRESDDIVMGTNDIAKQVGMSGNGVKIRLEDLEDENRVVSQKIGSNSGYTYVWGLHPNERQEPITPEIDRLVKWCDTVSSLGKSVVLAGTIAVAVGAVLWFGVMTTALLGGGTTDLFSQIHALGYSIAGGGSAALAAGASVHLFSLAAVKLAEFLI